ncbi:hypothetical protein EDB83DRAFT_2318980 [Lactarius deliciosus]|nr:hypothetical protein EDB83DRAFT_2318980 [Lactarius deliciosus]
MQQEMVGRTEKGGAGGRRASCARAQTRGAGRTPSHAVLRSRGSFGGRTATAFIVASTLAGLLRLQSKGLFLKTAREGTRQRQQVYALAHLLAYSGGAKGGSGPAWSPSCVYVNEVEGANEGYLPFPRPLCVNRRRATRKREGRGTRGKWGPAVPAPVPPLRENRDEGSKDLFPFPRKRRRGRKGRPSPRSCILFGRDRGRRGGKRGRPREEAEGGQRGAVRCAATRRGAPPTRPIGHAERGDIKEGGRTDRKGQARERVERGARIAQKKNDLENRRNRSLKLSGAEAVSAVRTVGMMCWGLMYGA